MLKWKKYVLEKIYFYKNIKNITLVGSWKERQKLKVVCWRFENTMMLLLGTRGANRL